MLVIAIAGRIGAQSMQRPSEDAQEDEQRERSRKPSRQDSALSRHDSALSRQDSALSRQDSALSRQDSASADRFQQYRASAIPKSERSTTWCALLRVKFGASKDAAKEDELCAKGVRKSKAIDAAAIVRDSKSVRAEVSEMQMERMQQRVAFVMLQLCEKYDCTYSSGLGELVPHPMLGLALIRKKNMWLHLMLGLAILATMTKILVNITEICAGGTTDARNGRQQAGGAANVRGGGGVAADDGAVWQPVGDAPPLVPATTCPESTRSTHLDGWMDGWMGRWVGGWMDRYGRVDRWTDG